MGKRRRSSGSETKPSAVDPNRQGKKTKKSNGSSDVLSQSGKDAGKVRTSKTKRIKKKEKDMQSMMKPSESPTQGLYDDGDKMEPYFHGATCLRLPSGDFVRAQSIPEQHNYLKKVSAQSEKLISLIHDSLTAMKKTEDDVDIEEQLASDMIRMKRVPLAKRYVEMTLWRRVRLFNEEGLSAAQSVGYGGGHIEDDVSSKMLLHSARNSDARFVSYRDAYLKGVVERFQDDLEKIREREALDAGQVSSLLRSLEAGADLFSTLKCVDDVGGVDM